jgi:hypothetical protein
VNKIKSANTNKLQAAQMSDEIKTNNSIPIIFILRAGDVEFIQSFEQVGKNLVNSVSP